jgi:hypothetical protein
MAKSDRVRYVSTFRAPTEYERQLEEARRRAALAEALAQQEYQPMEGTAAPIPKAAPLVKALQGYLTAREGRLAKEAAAEAEKAGRQEFTDYIRSFEPEQRTVGMGEIAAMEAPMPMINTTPGGPAPVQAGQPGFRATEYAQPSAIAAPNQRLMPAMTATGEPDFSQPMQMQVGGPLTTAQKRARALEGFESTNPMVQQYAMAQFEATSPKRTELKVGDIAPDKFTPQSIRAAVNSGDYSLLVPVENRDSLVGKPSPADYTTASIAKFAKSGNYTDLVPVPRVPQTQIITERDKQKDEGNLRDQLQGRLKDMDWDGVKSAYQRIFTAPENVVGDVAIVYAVAKADDPTGAVRKEDFDVRAKSGDLGTQIKALYEEAATGRMLPKRRQELIDTAYELYKARENEVEALRNEYGNIAERSGLNVENVVNPFKSKVLERRIVWSKEKQDELDRLRRKAEGK